MDAVERHVTLPADLTEAWDLLTRPDDLAGWLGAEVELDPTPGSRGLVVDHDGTRRRLEVERVEAGRTLAWRWWVEGDEAAATEVEITLAPDLDGTLVHVVERPLVPAAAAGPSASSASTSASASSAWSHRLLHLEALLLVAAAVRG